MATELILICHGNTERRAGDRTLGWWSDAPLSEVGSRQALAAGEHLLETADVAALYASPLKRAKETADIIAQLVKVIVRIDANLREIDTGISPDLSYEEAAERYPGLVGDDGELPGRPLPGGETISHFQSRIQGAVERIVGRHRDAGPVIVVTHGGPVIAYLRAFFGFAAEDERAPFFACEAASMHAFRLDGDERTVLRLNDTAHLVRVPAPR